MKTDISAPVKRDDVADKLAGLTCYIGDMRNEDMLYAKTLRSKEARAKIASIEYPVMPEGYFIVGKNDIPGRNRVKLLLEDWPFFAEDVVNYIGEPIALIVGSDKAVIQELIAATKVIYQKLEPILSIDDSGLLPIYGETNSFADYSFGKGDIDKVKRIAKYIYEGTYETGYQEQFYLEPQGVIAEFKEGKATIYGSLQCPYYIKNAVIDCLGISSDRVRIVQATTGGAFGGKEDYPSLLAGQAACAALKANKPVCLLLERNEDIECTTKRHPSRIRLTSYVDEGFKLIGLEADIVIDAGAYAGLSGVVLQRAMFAAAGVYNVENLRVHGKAIATNKVVSGAFRGFGSPQAFFAIEMHMEHAAKEMGVDPMEFKLQNVVKKWDKSTTGGIFRDKNLLPEMVQRVTEMSGFAEKKQTSKKPRNDNKRRGIGLSMFLHGCGFTGNGERDHIKAHVKLAKNSRDEVEILISNVEMGQGINTTMKKIAANALEIPIERVIFINPDTDRVPDSGPTVASRTIVVVGRLVYEAAIELKEKWQVGAVQEAECSYQYPEGYEWDNDSLSGDAYTNYSWGVNAVEVELDTLTFESKIIGVWAVFDIGKSIDDRIVKGQIDGGIVQGLGYASMEVMENQQGRFKQRSSTDYIIPTAMDIPIIQSELMCQPYSGGPFGAKGLGELTLVGSPIAYALAIEDAIDAGINSIPVRPELLMEVMADDKKY
ncbi:MAG: aldehyde oxidase [Clostridiales bacterium GWB2_37_7]|nr:MAG: aldehyde oxidase [Clostridiales bacterium GWB2_37_7]